MVWFTGKYSAHGYGLQASTEPNGMVVGKYRAQWYGWQESTVAKGMVCRQVQRSIVYIASNVYHKLFSSQRQLFPLSRTLTMRLADG
ncbi:hypothetical protein DPMN_053560 [Dreissena polymorpha]|uniref:Uncharacterized protein n=1 Tax=Dreissena polymorpha TaxID=45954 RepID=A0A9D4CMV2_DREPO|nr:hypothetical protein DPMN_053560 [Dreissena polymorpha]